MEQALVPEIVAPINPISIGCLPIHIHVGANDEGRPVLEPDLPKPQVLQGVDRAVPVLGKRAVALAIGVVDAQHVGAVG
jgi:hypothetical protein